MWREGERRERERERGREGGREGGRREDIFARDRGRLSVVKWTFLGDDPK